MDDSARLQLGAVFDTAAEGYDARPPYPEAIYPLLAERCGLGPGSRVLEIGPGTGQATLRILEFGAEVTAIEPGAELLLDEFVGSTPYALDVPARTADIDATAAFGPVEHHVVAWQGHHDAIGIRRLFATYSPWLALPEARRTRVLDALERLAREDFADVVVRPYQTSLFLAQRTNA